MYEETKRKKKHYRRRGDNTMTKKGQDYKQWSTEHYIEH